MVGSARTGSADAVRVSCAYLGKRLGADLAAFAPDRWDNVHTIARRLRSGVVQAIHQLGDAPQAIAASVPLRAGFDNDVTVDRGRGFLGPRGPLHGLSAHSHYFSGFHALEPHYTKTLARLLSPAHAGTAAVERAKTLVAALYDAAGRHAGDTPAFAGIGAGLVSESEVMLPRQGRKRIDVLLRWTDRAGNPHALVIEAKFGAPVRDDALAAYQRFAASQTAGCPGCLHLFLAVSRPDPAATARHRHWRQVTWISVLRHWERRLAVTQIAHDDEFTHFRSALWQRAVDRR